MRIVCLTSNDYHNCLVPFMHYWNQFAGADRFVTIAGYEAPPPYDLPDNCEFLRIGKQADYTWSSGLLKLLDILKEDTFILLLEDYFLTNDVNWAVVDECFDLVRWRTEIVKIDLSDDRLKVPYSLHRPLKNGRLIETDADAPFQTSVQAAVWKAEHLKQLLVTEENAWQFEKNGTKRLIQYRNQRPHSMWVFGTTEPPMQYANMVGGMGNKPGVLEKKHCPDWMWNECVAMGWAN